MATASITLKGHPVLRRVKWSDLCQGDRIYLPGRQTVGTIAAHYLALRGEFYNHDTQDTETVPLDTPVYRWEAGFPVVEGWDVAWYPVEGL